MHNGSIYAYNGAFETFNNMCPSASRMSQLTKTSEKKNDILSSLLSPSKHTETNGLIKKLPAVFYWLISEYLGEKLPLIIFTNRVSFRVWLSHLISEY